MSSSISAHAVLLKTVHDIQDRAAVEDCLRDMLIDVEMSIHLQEKLQTHQQIQRLQKRIQEQEYIIAETKAIRKETQQHQVAMADALMKELMELSMELGTLKDMKEQHEKLLIQYDEVVAKLIQTEEDRNNAILNDNPENTVAPLETGTQLGSSIAHTSTDNQVIDTNIVEASRPTSSDPTTSISVGTDQQFGDQESTIVKPNNNSDAPATDNIPNIEMTGSTDELDDGTVALVKEVRFDEFEKDIFLKIFSFLDALDILNTAQINVSMYSRVDSFFDFGDAQEEDKNQQKSVPSSLDIPSNATTSMLPAASKGAINEKSAVVEIQKSNVTSSMDINQPTVVALPPVTSTKTTATATKSNNLNFSTPISTAATPSLMAVPTLTSPPKHAQSKSNDSAILNRTIFSLLQPRQRTTANTGTSISNSANVSPVPSSARNFLRPLTDSIANTPTSSANNTGSTGGALTMNSTMANSMAAKLSDAELNAIILMTERLKQKEIIADKLTKENEALLAKLDGTEGVKQFLINKVRDMEVSLSALIQNETKVVQQIASDQEVIAFLDGRVQELEHVTKVQDSEKEAAKTELERIQKQSAQKVTVISDMLQFEREKLADQEREWKMTKKLLVKEVKSCRSQIIALQSERDGYREQSDTLRRALLSSSHNHSSTPSNGNSSKHRDRAYA